MPNTVPCPCCEGAGLVHVTWDESEVLECVECDASGRVVPEHREALLAWRGECRRRRRGDTARPAPRARRQA